MHDPRPVDGEQLSLPIEPATGPAGQPRAGRRRRTRRRGPRQLWLFAPFRQPELPLRGEASEAQGSDPPA